MAKPGDANYEHVPGQMDLYDVLEEIEDATCNHVDPPDRTCPFCGATPHRVQCPELIREAVQQRLKGEAGGRADQGK